MLSWVAKASSGAVIVSCLVVVGFIVVVALLLVKPVALDDHTTSILTLLVGALSNEFGHVVQYHVGSSAGSKDKDSVLHAIARNATGSTDPGKAD
jgi:hypothetical protein